MFNERNTVFKLTINGGSGCQLRLLVVGEGGHGNACGGGSGFIQYYTSEMPSNASSPYNVEISFNKTSIVIVKGTNGLTPVVITALPGQDATETKGGNGYSGGEDIFEIRVLYKS